MSSGRDPSGTDYRFGQRFVRDFIGTSGPKTYPQSAPRRQSIEADSQQVVDLIGGGGWTRTSDLRKDGTTRKKKLFHCKTRR